MTPNDVSEAIVAATDNPEDVEAQIAFRLERARKRQPLEIEYERASDAREAIGRKIAQDTGATLCGPTTIPR